MLGYIIRRCIVAVFVVIGVAAITFAILHWISPSPVYSVLSKPTRAAVNAWNRTHGYDRPEVTQFLSYLSGIIHGNLGFGYKFSQSVMALFKENFGRSVYLSGAALVLSLIIAIPLGILQAVKRNSPLDYTATAINFALYSMPSFFLGLILIQVLALDLNVFPAVVSNSVNNSTWAAITHPKQLFLPVVTLALLNVASYSRYMRSAALDELAQDYIRLARAKGLAEKTVLTRHLFRNACLPVITLVGLSIPYLVAGNLLIEVLFNYPGLGLLFYNALQVEDYNVLLAYTLLGAVLTVLGNLFADVAIASADPRVRLD